MRNSNCLSCRTHVRTARFLLGSVLTIRPIYFNKTFFAHFRVLQCLFPRLQPCFDLCDIKKTIWVFLTKFEKLFLSLVSFVELLKADDKLFVIGDFRGWLLSLIWFSSILICQILWIWVVFLLIFRNQLRLRRVALYLRISEILCGLLVQ